MMDCSVNMNWLPQPTPTITPILQLPPVSADYQGILISKGDKCFPIAGQAGRSIVDVDDYIEIPLGGADDDVIDVKSHRIVSALFVSVDHTLF